MRRAQFDEGSQIHRNLSTNPNMVSATSGTVQRTNFMTNSRFEAAGASPITVRTNLLTNPNLETLGAQSTARTNLCINPSMEASSGASSVRSNLVTSSRGVSALTGYGAQTITPNVPITGHPEGFVTALRVTYGATGSNPGVQLLDVTETGATYYMSAWVYHEEYVSGGVAFAQQGVTSQPSPPAVVVGQWRKVSWTRTSTGTSSLGYRVSSQGGAGAFLITGMQVEKYPGPVPYFDALTTTTNRAPNPSMESASGSVTLRTNLCVNPRPSTTSDYSLGSTGTATTFTGGKPAVQATANGTQTPYVFSARSASAVSAGETYALSSLVEFSSGVGRVHIRAHRRTGNEYFTSGQIINYDPTGKGVHRISVLFTSPSALPANELDFSLVFYNSSGSVPASGEWARMGEVLIEKVGSVMPYFDGSTTANSDFTYAWTGTANASTSVQRGQSVSWWAARWFGANGGQGYSYRSAGTGVDGGYSFRKVWTSENTGSTQDVGIALVSPVVEGSTYTASIYQKSSAPQNLTSFIDWLDSAGSMISRTPLTNAIDSPADVWVRGHVTGTAPAGAVNGKFIFGPYSSNSYNMPAGATLDYDWAMIEESPVLNAYQDGTAAAPGDFTYTWAGTAHNSASNMRSVGVTGYTSGLNAVVSQSREWSNVGARSLRITPNSTSADSFAVVPFTLETGKTYTISATLRLDSAQTGNLDASRARRIYVYHSNASAGGTVNGSVQASNTAGVTQHSVTFTVTDGSQYQNIRLYNGAAQGGGDVWWDNVLIEEADHAMPYFDGSTTPAQDWTHVWSGTAHASTSLMRGTLPSGASNSGWRFAHSSTEWSARGTRSIKIPHLVASIGSTTDNFVEIQNMISGGLKANTTYTLSATCRTAQVLTGTVDPNALKFRANVGGDLPFTYTSTKSNTPGITRVVGRFTTNATTSIAFIRALAGASYGNGDVWWDEFCLEEGITDGTYFDGDYSSKENLVKENVWALSGASVAHNISYGGSTWTRATNTTYGTSFAFLRQMIALNDLSQGASYTIGMTVRNEDTVTSTVHVDWCDGPSQQYTLQAGETKRIVGTFSARNAGYTSVYRFIDIGFSQSATTYPSILIKDILVERGTTSGEHYTGSEFTSSWQGTANASVSYQKAPSALNWAPSSNGVPYQSAITSFLGTKSGGVQTRGTNGDGLYHQDINVTAGSAYTFSSWVKITSAVPTFSGVLRFKDSAQTILADLGGTVHTQLVVGEWARVAVTGVAPANSTKLQVMWRIYSSHTPTTFYVDGAMVEMWPTIQDFFDGSSANTTDLTYEWLSTANASSSVLKSRVVTGTVANKSSANPDSRFPLYQVTAEDGSPISRWIAPKGTANAVWRVAGITTTGFDFSRIKAGGLYTVWIRYRTSGWPINNTLAIQISTPSSQNHIIGSQTVPLNQTGWQEYRRTFTALRDGDVTHILYLSLPVTPTATEDGTLDVRDWGIFEGEYAGDLIHGSLPFSKWEGTANNSTSIGYPPQLFDIAGKPLIDTSAMTNIAISLDNDTFDPAEPRTFYTVVEQYLVPSTSVFPIVTYGNSGLTDIPENTTMLLRSQGNTTAFLNRRTGGGGPQVSNVKLQSRNVACWGMTDSGHQFVSNNGTNPSVSSQVMSIRNQNIRIHSASTVNSLPSHTHLRTIMYRGYHDAATRTAITRYLANKYGATVL